ncbi:MAG: hypothetical protein A2289_04720 [Deltaproteobacteria bacterium RIFOXYA12_FULL_58_15]|nr:MAG: hypothetical protein A2289_04720 [Deltaproteobacteria bacterium RIFOXYA12_FULL_58_15]OGR09891.1 MAG: hypothetical protein A2341_27240 [Deltaproteobacteria bacterium RIFOXYB12_FULL_58_9]
MEALLGTASFHYDASTANGYQLGSGKHVLTWRDRSAHGYHARAAVRSATNKKLMLLGNASPTGDMALPVLVKGAINGFDAIRFAGGAALQTPAGQWGQTFTAVVVAQSAATQPGGYARILDIATNAMIAGPEPETGNHKVHINPYPTPTMGHTFGAQLHQSPFVIAWSYDNGRQLVLLNRVGVVDDCHQVSLKLDGPIGIGNLLINPNHTYWYHGHIGEVVFYDRALGGAELARISDALMEKWHIGQ